MEIDVVRLLWPGPPETVEEVVKLGRSFIGDDHPSREVLQARVNANPLCLAVALPSNNFGDLLAYSLVYPLSELATERVFNGKITAGRDLSLEDISSGNDISSLYVAMVAAHSTQRVAAMRLLLWQVSGFLRIAGSAEVLFARQATEEGGKLMSKVGLSGVVPGNTIKVARAERYRKVLDPSPINDPPDRKDLARFIQMIRRSRVDGQQEPDK